MSTYGSTQHEYRSTFLHVADTLQIIFKGILTGNYTTCFPSHFADSLLLRLEPEIVLPLAENRRFSRTNSIFHKLHKRHFELPIFVALQHAKGTYYYNNCTRT